MSYNKYNFFDQNPVLFSQSHFVYLHTNCRLPRCLVAMETLQLYSTRTKLFELNRSTTEWRCLVWKNRYGLTYFDEFMTTCLRGAVFLRHSVGSLVTQPGCVWVGVPILFADYRPILFDRTLTIYVITLSHEPYKVGLLLVVCLHILPKPVMKCYKCIC